MFSGLLWSKTKQKCHDYFSQESPTELLNSDFHRDKNLAKVPAGATILDRGAHSANYMWTAGLLDFNSAPSSAFTSIMLNNGHLTGNGVPVLPKQCK